MGASILYQLQQLHINSGALSVPNASQHYLTVSGVSACSLGQQVISTNVSTVPCISACSAGQQNMSPNLNIAAMTNVGNICIAMYDFKKGLN